jgi:hypothetical protein
MQKKRKKKETFFHNMPLLSEKNLQTFPKKVLNFVWPIKLNLK